MARSIGQAGRYRLTRRVDELRVPATVQATLAARIDRLSERDKVVLQTAAVIGRTFSTPVLAAVTADRAEDLNGSLRNLCAAEFLQERSDGDTAEHRFWHALTHEVAYGSLLSEHRARIHVLPTAAVLVESDPARQDERAALIASHFQAANDLWNAAQWNARAAIWAMRTSVDEGLRRRRMVIGDLDQLEATEDALRLSVRAHGSLLRLGARHGTTSEEAEALIGEEEPERHTSAIPRSPGCSSGWRQCRSGSEAICAGTRSWGWNRSA